MKNGGSPYGRRARRETVGKCPTVSGRILRSRSVSHGASVRVRSVLMCAALMWIMILRFGSRCASLFRATRQRNDGSLPWQNWTGKRPSLRKSSCTRSPGCWKSRLPTATRSDFPASFCGFTRRLRRCAAMGRARRSCRSGRRTSRSRTSSRSAPTRSYPPSPTATVRASIPGIFSTTTDSARKKCGGSTSSAWRQQERAVSPRVAQLSNAQSRSNHLASSVWMDERRSRVLVPQYV